MIGKHRFVQTKAIILIIKFWRNLRCPIHVINSAGKKTRFSPLPVIYAAPQFWVENDPFSEVLLWCSRVSTTFQTQTKILDNAYSCLQWGICTRWLLYFIYAMYNELSAALLLVHYAKSSLIKDRIPSRAQRTILPPHCYPFLFDGNLRSGVIYLFIYFLLLSFFGSRENGAETPIWALIRWLKLLFEEKFAPGKRECLWLHSMKFYCVQEAKFVSVNLKTFAFATMLLILATRKALFYKALFSCTLPHKFQQVQRRRPRLLIRKNCCSE